MKQDEIRWSYTSYNKLERRLEKRKNGNQIDIYNFTACKPVEKTYINSPVDFIDNLCTIQK